MDKQYTDMFVSSPSYTKKEIKRKLVPAKQNRITFRRLLILALVMPLSPLTLDLLIALSLSLISRCNVLNKFLKTFLLLEHNRNGNTKARKNG